MGTLEPLCGFPGVLFVMQIAEKTCSVAGPKAEPGMTPVVLTLVTPDRGMTASASWNWFCPLLFHSTMSKLALRSASTIFCVSTSSPRIWMRENASAMKSSSAGLKAYVPVGAGIKAVIIVLLLVGLYDTMRAMGIRTLGRLDRRIYFRRYSAVQHARLKAALAVLKSKPCTDCGKTDLPGLMDHDHVPERGEKKFCINAATMKKLGFAEELAKCDLVCVRCHRIRTLRRRLSA